MDLVVLEVRMTIAMLLVQLERLKERGSEWCCTERSGNDRMVLTDDHRGDVRVAQCSDANDQTSRESPCYYASTASNSQVTPARVTVTQLSSTHLNASPAILSPP